MHKDRWLHICELWDRFINKLISKTNWYIQMLILKHLITEPNQLFLILKYEDGIECVILELSCMSLTGRQMTETCPNYLRWWHEHSRPWLCSQLQRVACLLVPVFSCPPTNSGKNHVCDGFLWRSSVKSIQKMSSVKLKDMTYLAAYLLLWCLQ